MRQADWDRGGFARGKGFPSTACIGGGERCAGAIEAKPDVPGKPGRAGPFGAAASRTALTRILAAIDAPVGPVMGKKAWLFLGNESAGETAASPPSPMTNRPRLPRATPRSPDLRQMQRSRSNRLAIAGHGGGTIRRAPAPNSSFNA